MGTNNKQSILEGRKWDVIESVYIRLGETANQIKIRRNGLCFYMRYRVARSGLHEGNNRK